MENIFRNAKKEAFRLETLQIYDVPYSKSGYKEWLRLVNYLKKKDVKIIRLHLLKFPLTEYKVYEIQAHKKQGNKLFAIDKKKIKKRLKDFWLIDRRFVILLNFDSQYRFVSYEVLKGKKVAKFVKLRDSLLEKSEPLFELLKKKKSEI